MELDFEIDKITESIENAETGETLNTLRRWLRLARNRSRFERNNQTERHVYKLVAEQEPKTRAWYRLKNV